MNGREHRQVRGDERQGETGAVWLDPKLRFPAKWQGKNGGGELRNIQEGSQPASLFEIPAGYTNVRYGQHDATPAVTLSELQHDHAHFNCVAPEKSHHYTQRSGSLSLSGATMSLSAVIVDDEQLARDELAYLLKNADDVNVVAQGKNGLEAVNLIKEHNPDLVFLDVQMPGLDGFGVIKKLLDRKIPLPKIVFATAFDQYAVKAFEVNAVDYLLKPFDKKRVAQAIQKARANRTPASRLRKNSRRWCACSSRRSSRHLKFCSRRWGGCSSSIRKISAMRGSKTA